jgi:GT2 family glycosyltransferase
VPDRASVAIVIVSYNVRDELERCLSSLSSQRDATSTTITVVDNGSTDGTIEMLGSHWPRVALIETGANVGFARATNTGIRTTAAEFVLLLNPDTVVKPGALDALVHALRSRADAAAVGPRLLDGDGRPELSFGWPVSPIGELRQKLTLAAYRRGSPAVVRWIDRWTREPGARYWLSGACLLVRRSDLEAVGLLDERFFMYLEDVDLCLSLRRRGRAVLFVPAAEVCHLRGRSVSNNPAVETWRRRSQITYYGKWHPSWVPFLRFYARLRRSDFGD